VLVLLDSTVLIDYLRDRPVTRRVDALASTGDEPCTTGINVEEIMRGLFAPELAGAVGLFEGLQVLPVGLAQGWQAGDWRRQHAAKGITLAQADCLVAATAAAHHAILATGNPRDFPMQGLVVEHWPVGG